MNINEFNNALLYSNRNVEKLAKKLVNESANAVLMEMFDDKCILADHTTGQIFESKYDFDGKTFTFFDFNRVNLEKDNSSLKEALNDYLDGKNVDLAEAYELCSDCSSDVFEESLANALASKNESEITDYTELAGINEEIGDFKNSDFFKLYEQRLNDYPTESIKMFDWSNPVKVSLIDEDHRKIVNKSFKKKAGDLRKNIDFKHSLMEAAKDYLDYGATTLFEQVIGSYPEVLALDKAGFKELIGYSMIGDKDLTLKRKTISEGFESFIENDDVFSERRETLLEEVDEDSEEDKAPEATEDDLDALKAALEKAKSKVSDEKLLDKIEELESAIDSGKESGETDVGAVKESIELLRF